jgi:hypothetical protein
MEFQYHRWPSKGIMTRAHAQSLAAWVVAALLILVGLLTVVQLRNVIRAQALSSSLSILGAELAELLHMQSNVRASLESLPTRDIDLYLDRYRIITVGVSREDCGATFPPPPAALNPTRATGSGFYCDAPFSVHSCEELALCPDKLRSQLGEQQGLFGLGPSVLCTGFAHCAVAFSCWQGSTRCRSVIPRLR